MPTETIPTLFCINAGYSQHLAVTLISLIENNPEFFFDAVVVFTGSLGECEHKLRRSVERYSNISLRLIQFEPPGEIRLPLRIHYSVDIYSRLWVDSFFAPDVERVLYLDADTVVVGSIREMWETDLAGNILGAVTIPGSDRGAYLGIPPEREYFNSGVLLLDLAAWRRERIADRIFDYIRANADRLIDPDQDALNACLSDRRLTLDYIWNVISPFYFNYHPLGLPESERRSVQERARIIHFNGASKPWDYLSRHPRRHDYLACLERSDWRGFRPENRNLVGWIKRNVWYHLDRLLSRRERQPKPAAARPPENKARRTLAAP